MNVMLQIKEKFAESATHSLSSLSAPEFQLYLAIHNKMNTKFLVVHTGQHILLNGFCGVKLGTS